MGTAAQALGLGIQTDLGPNYVVSVQVYKR
jgi:hypothetical protein